MKMLFILAALLVAQTAQRPGGAIEGTVLDSVTMLPLADAMITVAGGSAPIQTLSDQTGHFIIPNISSGPYTVVAVSEDHFGPEISVFVMERQTSRITLSMVPAGSLAGTILTDEGAPAVGANVQLLRMTYPGGVPTLSGVGSQNTDERGDYRIPGLRPGEYYIAASPRPAPAGARATSALVRTFFPSALDLSQASMTRLYPARDLTGINVTLRKGNLFRIAGQVISAIPDSESRGATTATVTLLPRGGATLQDPNAGKSASIALGSPGNGRFEIPDVYPGVYDVYASLPLGRGTGIAYGRTIVTVNGVDPEGVILTIHQGVDVGGKVTVDGGLSPSFNNVRISIQPEDSASRLAAYQQVSHFQPTIDPDGSFTIPTVPEGTYRVQVAFAAGVPAQMTTPVRPIDPFVPDPTPPPGLVTVPLAGSPLSSNAYVADILQGGMTVYNTGILVGTQAFEPLELRVRTDGGAVEGIVIDGQSRPYAGATVVLAPLVQYRQNPALFRSAISDESGRFSMSGIRPGEYKLLAWESIAPGAYMNADILNDYRNMEIPVTVPANIRVETKITVIKDN